jgi:hypothetical protein
VGGRPQRQVALFITSGQSYTTDMRTIDDADLDPAEVMFVRFLHRYSPPHFSVLYSLGSLGAAHA